MRRTICPLFGYRLVCANSSHHPNQAMGDAHIDVGGRAASVPKAGGKPSTWLPPGGLVERSHANKQIANTNTNREQTRTTAHRATYGSDIIKNKMQHENGGSCRETRQHKPPMKHNTDKHKIDNKTRQPKKQRARTMPAPPGHNRRPHQKIEFATFQTTPRVQARIH